MSTDFTNISRIYQPEKNHCGWFVRLSINGKQKGRFFKDKKYGGREKALEAAKAHRDEWKVWREANAPLIKKSLDDGRWFLNQSHNSTTGVVGVYRTHKKSRHANKIYITFYYQATVPVGRNKTRTKAFNIRKLGEREAFLAAANYRHEAMVDNYGDKFDGEQFWAAVKAYLGSLSVEGHQ